MASSSKFDHMVGEKFLQSLRISRFKQAVPIQSEQNYQNE